MGAKQEREKKLARWLGFRFDVEFPAYIWLKHEGRYASEEELKLLRLCLRLMAEGEKLAKELLSAQNKLACSREDTRKLVVNGEVMPDARDI